MKKKFITIFFGLIIFSFLSYFVFIKPNTTRLVETFLRSFPKQEFKAKLKNVHPKWMDRQIEEDFMGFNKGSVNRFSIDNTFEKIQKTAPFQKKAFIRYRIINNKLYRYYKEKSELTKREPSFEKAIKTLLKLVKLPDMDLIYSDMDGTPEFYMPKDFYIMEDKNNQAPIFSRAKLKDAPYVVLIPDYYSVSTNWEKECLKILGQMKKYPWENKSSLAFWRGGSHDKSYDLKTFKSRPRVIISMLSKKYPQLIEAGITLTEQMQFKDVLLNENLIKEPASIEDHLKYKYLPVLDGYMCTYPGYQWRLLANCVCLKQESKEVQWFYLALRPFEHYIPIKNDMSDLVEKISWAKSSDDFCLEIANNATDFVRNNLMIEDVYLYLYKVLDSYASYLSIDKKDLIRDTLKDSNWICIQQRKKANKIILKRRSNEK